MVKEALVKSDIDIWGRVQVALGRARIPVTLYDWNYVPQLEEWQLTIATPWVDSRGPHEANARVIAALQEEGIYQDVPIRRVFVRSPDDPVVKALERELKTQTEGAIHIVEHVTPSRSQRYSVVFAPFTGPGGAMPVRNFTDADELRAFLEDRVRVGKSQIDNALSDLDKKRSASIIPVHLTKREAKSIGLA